MLTPNLLTRRFRRKLNDERRTSAPVQKSSGQSDFAFIPFIIHFSDFLTACFDMTSFGEFRVRPRPVRPQKRSHPRAVFVTGNANKLREVKAILAAGDGGIEVTSQAVDGESSGVVWCDPWCAPYKGASVITIRWHLYLHSQTGSPAGVRDESCWPMNAEY